MSSPTQTRSFKVESLPTTWSNIDELSHVALKYRDFRLQSLQTDPDAFASTYVEEVLFAEDVWRKRLQQPDVLHFMAYIERIGDGSSISNDNQKDWVGMIVVQEMPARKNRDVSETSWNYSHSHLRKENTTVKTSESSNTDASQALEWYSLHGTFVHPSARRRGLGKELLRVALAYVEERLKAHSLGAAQATVLVDSWNEKAISLYSSFGLEVVGKDKYQVGLSKRTALKMSQVMNRTNVDESI